MQMKLHLNENTERTLEVRFFSESHAFLLMSTLDKMCSTHPLPSLCFIGNVTHHTETVLFPERL